AVSPSDPNIVLAGTVGAGVLRSTDRGASWRYSNQGLLNRGITDVKFSASDPSVVYIATNYGACRSTDAGASWKRLNAPNLNIDLVSVDVHRTSPDILYVAGPHQAFRSTDGGQTWTNASGGLPQSYSDSINVVLADPSDPNTAYAGTSRGVFKSVNGGGNWSRSSAGIHTVAVVNSIASSSDGQVLYAGSAQYGLYKSTDRASTWEPVVTITNTFVHAIVVHPLSGFVYVANHIAGISRSTDGGRTWTVSNQGLTSLDFTGLCVDPAAGTDVYTGTPGDLFKSADSGTTWTSLSNLFTAHYVQDLLSETRAGADALFAATRGGVYKSTDHGKTWKNKSSGLGNLRVTGLEAGADNQTLYASTEGGFYRSTDGGDSWVGRHNGLLSTWINQLAGSLDAPGTFFAATQSGVFKTTDGGGNWTRSGTQFANRDIYLIGVHPRASNLVYAVTYGSPSGSLIYTSTDEGGTWRLASTTASYVFSFAFDPDELETFYAMFLAVGVHRSTDGGQTWKIANKGQHYDYGVLRTDPRQAGVVYLGTWGCVYKSDDRGENWLRWGGSFADAQIFSILEAGDREICVGTSAGVFASDSSQQSRLYFPLCRQAGGELTGFAISNSTDLSASLEARFLGSDGQLIAGAASNPTVQTLSSKRQAAQLLNEMFSLPAGAEASGWAEVLSNIPVSGFFQILGAGLDGGAAVSKPLLKFYFSRVLDGPTAFRNLPATTSISIANPGKAAATVVLSLHNLPGVLVAERTFVIPGRGSTYGRLRDIFSTPTDFTSGYVVADVKMGEGLVGFACVRLGASAGGTLIGLNAAEPTAGDRLYSGQMASGPGMFSSFRILNASAALRKATLYPIDEHGQPLASEAVLDLPAGAATDVDAGQLFHFAAANMVVGSFRIEADGPGLLGDVLFGEPDSLTLAAALPLQDQGLRHAVFSQVANGMGLFTGLALYVPGAETAAVTIEVYSADGHKTGEAQFEMPGRTRMARLLTELMPSTEGQIRGFVVIRSSQPIIAQELFAGADSMSAVPASPVLLEQP
ncbi:MAG: hypothetical protein EHM61_24320, partial [Acidobacteria bacterium]